MSTYRSQFTARTEGSPTRYRHVRYVSANLFSTQVRWAKDPAPSRGHYVNRKLANKSL